MKKEKLPDNKITFYESPDGSVNIEVLYSGEDIWLTQKKMSELFDTTAQNITQHLKKIYFEKEIKQEGTCKDFLQVQNEGGRVIERKAKMYFIGNMYLDYAELQAARGKVMTMKDWIEKLNAFLKFSEYEILTNAGEISHEVAVALAEGEYEKYRAMQDKGYMSDFDREVKKLESMKKHGK